MNADVIQEKTAVFSFGSLSRTEEPRLYDLDEPTRELPLIAGRFAGREWSAEELRRELREKDAPQGREMRRRRAVTLLTGALCAMLLLVVSMLGQACVSSRSAEGRPAAENVIVFSQKETVPAAAVHAEKMSAAELTGVQLLRETRGEISPSEGSDRITVLNVRRGRELRHFWQSLSDAFSAAGG